MRQIEVDEAAADFRNVVEHIRKGEEVTLVEKGRTFARVIPSGYVRRVHQPVQLGRLQGKYVIPDDFDAPLPDNLLDLFEGKA